ncbi:glycerol-3-phosphate dehydrogenase [Paenibacillus taihuensis]|uniref:Glycerol-3-phosphate dehydrogenase n=1 Tax=Paenibacillus taihuensis TaxID=1156355 RepID=A0A3D9R3B9_9BACL|nr:NAD(P)/FAD-dependent oxidoreductase [Paenibacillus taihuensis]REE67333.1 glycerol-3-phosphate dehydrogenase [Paenibacillus taihuensis]
MDSHIHDVVVIGGGIIGASILRELSQYDLHIVLVEKQPDVCEGTSKANSGIVHTGFDARPGSIEAECLRRSRERWPELIEQLRIPYLPCGAVMVAANEEERQMILHKYVPTAEANGVAVRWMEREELLMANPAVAPTTIGGLFIEGEGIIDPFWATRSFTELAVLNGAQIRLGNGVAGLERNAANGGLTVVLQNGEIIETRFVINAAGLWSDEIARLVGDESFSITPRKGQFILTEEQIEISQIILPVPSPTSKGILVTPVVFGGYILGPTAEDQQDKWDRSTTEQGLTHIISESQKLLPDASRYASIRQFAGVRAVGSTGDFIIGRSVSEERLIHAAGIRSTGVSASPGVAELVVDKLIEAGLELIPKQERSTSLSDLFEDDREAAGEIICLCRSITQSEVKRAGNGLIPCRTLDGVKRRTGATLGECQGNYCIPSILDVLYKPEDEDGLQLVKGLTGSVLAQGGEDVEV